jgi:hypothetical protein
MLPLRLVILFFVPLLAAAQNASLRGVAVNALSHQPIARVHIRLLKVSSRVAGDVYGAMSDDKGHFSIANISPGAYYAIPEHTGFVATPPAKNPRAYAGVTLRAGENITDFRVELTPASMIRGRVVDEYGDPLARARVQIEADSQNGPSFSLQAGGAFAQTDDRGEFVATGLPGRYYVSANDFRGARPASRNEIRTDGTTDPVYSTTYFSNSVSKEGATVIEVKPGEEGLPIEIRMSRQQNLSISGAVSGFPAGARPRVVLVQTASSDGASGSRFSFTSPADEDGRFSFSRLPPGSYRLSATYESQQTAVQSQILSVSISNADVTGVVLPLTELGGIAGVVEVAGSKSVLRGTIRLTSRDLSPYEAMGSSSVPIEKDGSFHIARVAATRHEIGIDPLPENAFIQSVIVDGVAQAGSAEFEIASGARTAALKISVNLNGGQLSGIIADQDGSVMTGGTSTVYLAQDLKDMPRARFTRVKEDGSYLIQGIRPGKYHLFATDLFRSPGARDQRALEELTARAEEIEIQAGDRLTRKLTPLSSR